MAVLGSGSSGNATFLATERVRLLIDAGLSGRETLRRMALIGETLESLDAILITHEHSDHINGLAGLARKAGRGATPVYISSRTRLALPPQIKLPAVESFEPGCRFEIGEVAVEPFTIPHDAVDPVAFRFTAEGVRVAIVTDLGYMPQNVKHYLSGCHGLILESNHDLEMLRSGPYPWYVKQRVGSQTGHLSNEALGKFLRQEFDREARVLVLAHLSQQNNHPEIARLEAASALEEHSAGQTKLTVSSQTEPTEVFWF